MYLPVMIDLNKNCICVVGGGRIALRKVKKIIHEGGYVKCIAIEFSEEFKNLERVELIEDAYQVCLIKESKIVIAATNNREINKRILKDCRELNILCSDVSDSLSGDIIFPAAIVKDEFVISFSTLGNSPVLAKKILDEIYELVNDRYLNKIDLLGKIRKKALKYYKNDKEKKEYLRSIVELDENGLEEELKNKF